MAMNFRRWWLLAAFAALCVPGFSQPVPFSFTFTWTNPLGVDNPNPSGTCTPYGACYESNVRIGGFGVGGGLVMANGALDFAGPACTSTTCTITATGGTGIFSGATGSGTISLDITTSGGSYTETDSGSIQLTLAGGQGVTISPGSLQLETALGTTPAVGGLVLNNQEATSISFTTAASADTGSWLSVSPASGTVAAGSTGALVVTANPTGLPLGVYNGQISVTFTGGAQTILVVFVVGNSGAKLQLSQTGLFLKAVSGGPSPAPGLISVANTGIGTLAGLTATASVTGSVPNWLQASIAPGFAGQTQTTVSVSVNPGSLPPGTHFGQVSFALPGAVNSPQTATVQVIVGSALPTFQPAGVVTRVPFDSYTRAVGTIPPGVNVTITNPSLETLSFTVTTPGGGNPLFPSDWTNNVPYFNLSATSGSIPSGGSVILVVSVNATCLINNTCIPYLPEFSPWDVWAVTFPAINYTYYLIGTLGFVGPSSAPPIPSWGSPPTGVTLPGVPRTAPATRDRHLAGAGDICTPSVLEGKITSLPLMGVRTAIGQPTPLEVTAFDNCGNSFNSGSVVASFSTGEPPVSLAPMGGGQWSATWVPSVASSTAVITLQGVSEDGLQGGGTLPTVIASSTTPLVTPGAVLNAASSTRVLAPGSFISIYGVNMASQNTYASSTPFPTLLGSTRAFLGGEPLPLQFSGSKQINAVIPYDIAINSVQQLVVQAGDALSQPEPVLIAAAAPGVFTQDQSGSGPGAILVQPAGSSKSATNTPANPAKAGDALLIFCTGLGAVTPKVTAGSIAPSSPPAKTDNPVTATIGGIDAPVLFAGLAPGFVALYQVNVTVPSGIAAAPDVPLILSVAGQVSRPVTVAIR
jgi:uncharacterized protein (TIGR03437 family)